MGDLIYPLGLTADEQAALKIPEYAGDRYRMDFSIGEICAYLNRVKECVRKNAFTVLKGDQDDPEDTRHKNSHFMRRYGLWQRDRQRDLLLGIAAEEFCHTVICNDGRLLYVFCLDRTLYKAAAGYELVRLYVKHEYAAGVHPYDVVVSMHELELPILRAFES